MEKEVIICMPSIETGEYDKRRDRFEVSQSGFLDLCDAFAHHAVPSSVNGEDGDYNDVDDPSMCIGRPKDAFEVMHYRETVRAAQASKSISADPPAVE